ncbi:MAG: class I SAM-dependent methyltransferase, partial [Nostocoides sp.]
MPGSGPVGSITRGTTNPNRLRRVDRWLVDVQGWRLRRSPGAPVVVDLGYGASPVTAVELHDRLRRVRPDVEVVGLEIDPERVRAAAPLGRLGLRFAHGGFEIPLPDDGRATMVRAFNVLRQYPEAEVPAVWATVVNRLAPQGILVDGTCDEIGRLSTWVA